MPVFYGLKLIDIGMIIGYFVAVMCIGFWASRKVKNEDDYFLGGRSFGKGLLVMHWLCTGTHSEQAVQVAGASARVGLGGIWYQWMWLFSTPFYWLIAPITRRLRVTTTGDFFRIRYSPRLEMLYSAVAILFYIQSIAMLLRGAGAAISGATGGAIPTRESVVLLSILFSTYVMAGGLIAAAYTDYLQGVMIIVLSIMLVPAGLQAVGGAEGLRATLDPSMFLVTAPAGSKEGDPWFVLSMSILGLAGIVVQPHVMSATGSGKTEMEARVGMCYGNFIKRLLTIAWAFTGILAAVRFADLLGAAPRGSEEARHVSETLFGQAIQHFLGDGWRGLMIACLIAGVTSAETFMVVGSGIFTRNFYLHIAPNRGDRHYLWVGRFSAAALLIAGIAVGLFAQSITQILVGAIQMIALLGAAFWLGVVWRRANSAGVWASFCGALLVWLATSFDPGPLAGVPLLGALVQGIASLGEVTGLRTLAPPVQTLLMLGVEFGLLILVSLATPPQPDSQLDPFFARLLTPVGREDEMAGDADGLPADHPALLGLDGRPLDYARARSLAAPGLERMGFVVPRWTRLDWGGFLGAWVLVGALIVLLYALSAWVRG